MKGETRGDRLSEFKTRRFVRVDTLCRSRGGTDSAVVVVLLIGRREAVFIEVDR